MSHIHICWQREDVLLIPWGCRGSTSPAQAQAQAQSGIDQDNPRLLPGLEQRQVTAWESLQACSLWDYL